MKEFSRKIIGKIIGGRDAGPLRMVCRGFIVFFVFLIVFSAFIIGTDFVFERVFHINSENAVTYFIRDDGGRIKVVNDLGFDQAHRLVFMIDFNCVFNLLDEIEAVFVNKPLIELSWNNEKGEGIIKEFRPDGSKFLVVLSRFVKRAGIPDGASVKGLFIGGDLPYGDVDAYNDRSRNNTGMAFYDGKRWYHIWCAINEGMILSDQDATEIPPWGWNYLGSRVLKASSSEVVIESMHELGGITSGALPVGLLMKRTLYKRGGDDYVILKIEYSNTGTTPIIYTYSFGDEPWVGNFGTSKGNVGWADGVLYRRQGLVLTDKHKFAGYWDIGNDDIGEGHNFTGYANFVEWVSHPPDFVYFANNFTPDLDKLDSSLPLDSYDNRIINLLWLDEVLKPGESKTHTFALGMAGPDTSGKLPVKPAVRPPDKF